MDDEARAVRKGARFVQNEEVCLGCFNKVGTHQCQGGFSRHSQLTQSRPTLDPGRFCPSLRRGHMARRGPVHRTRGEGPFAGLTAPRGRTSGVALTSKTPPPTASSARRQLAFDLRIWGNGNFCTFCYVVAGSLQQGLYSRTKCQWVGRCSSVTLLIPARKSTF